MSSCMSRCQSNSFQQSAAERPTACQWRRTAEPLSAAEQTAEEAMGRLNSSERRHGLPKREVWLVLHSSTFPFHQACWLSKNSTPTLYRRKRRPLHGGRVCQADRSQVGR